MKENTFVENARSPIFIRRLALHRRTESSLNTLADSIRDGGVTREREPYHTAQTCILPTVGRTVLQPSQYHFKLRERFERLYEQPCTALNSHTWTAVFRTEPEYVPAFTSLKLHEVSKKI